MNSLIKRSCKGHVCASSRKEMAGRPVMRLVGAPTQRLVAQYAERREIERVNFGDVYLVMQERVATSGTLPKGDGRVMVESIRSLEQAQRVLALIARHVESKREMAGALELDWPVRKKWLARICEIGLQIPTGKQVILDIFANTDVFALSTYFAAEMVEELAANGADAALLTRVVELFRAKKPVGDKGVAAAYRRLLAILRERKDEAAAKAASAALRQYLAAPQAAAAEPAAVVAVAAAPAPATVNA